MSKIDEIFIQRCQEILATKEMVPAGRAKWPSDGKPANTKHICNVVNEYNVGEEFPIPTLRKQSFNLAVAEVLWIFQKKSNNIKDLQLNGKQLHIWDQWADSEGTIGKAYGYQIGKKFRFIGSMDGDPLVTSDKEKGIIYPSAVSDEDGWMWMDQMDSVLFQLNHNDTSRRILTSTFNFDELADMGLQPCAYSTTWTVEDGKLNLLLNQRSQDMLAASFWNVMQYSALLVMVAHATNHKIGKLTHVIGDCHIYDRHIPIIEELIKRPINKGPSVLFENRKTTIVDRPRKNTEIMIPNRNFYDYKPEDFIMSEFTCGAPIGKFEVAE